MSVCITDFLEEGKEFINNEVKDIPSGQKRLEAIIRSYVKFFIQYPGIFELFYITPLKNTNSAIAIITFLEEMCSADWKIISENGEHSVAEIKSKKESLKYSINGLLLLYNNRRYPDDYAKFQKSVDKQLEIILP